MYWYFYYKKKASGASNCDLKASRGFCCKASKTFNLNSKAPEAVFQEKNGSGGFKSKKKQF